MIQLPEGKQPPSHDELRTALTLLRSTARPGQMFVFDLAQEALDARIAVVEALAVDAEGLLASLDKLALDLYIEGGIREMPHFKTVEAAIRGIAQRDQAAQDRYNRLREAAVSTLAEMLHDQWGQPHPMTYYRLQAIDKLGLR